MTRKTFFDLPENVRDKIYTYSTTLSIFNHQSETGAAHCALHASGRYQGRICTLNMIKDYCRPQLLLEAEQCQALRQVLPEAEIQALLSGLIENNDLVYTTNSAIAEAVELVLALQVAGVVFDLRGQTVSVDWRVNDFINRVLSEAREQGFHIVDVIVLLPAVEHGDRRPDQFFSQLQLGMTMHAVCSKRSIDAAWKQTWPRAIVV